MPSHLNFHQLTVGIIRPFQDKKKDHITKLQNSSFPWEFQDPKMEVRKRTICLAIFSGDIP